MKGNPTQEDASEFFLFLLTLFKLPYLPLDMHLYHGATEEPNDDRIITERLIQVGIPISEDSSPVTLEEALIRHFHDNIVSGINRIVSETERQEGDNEKSFVPQEVPVYAWQVLKASFAQLDIVAIILIPLEFMTVSST